MYHLGDYISDDFIIWVLLLRFAKGIWRIHRKVCLLKGCEREVFRNCSAFCLFFLLCLSPFSLSCLKFFSGYQEGHLCASSSNPISYIGVLSIWNYYGSSSVNTFRASPFELLRYFRFWLEFFFLSKRIICELKDLVRSAQVLFFVVSSSPSASWEPQTSPWFSFLDFTIC